MPPEQPTVRSDGAASPGSPDYSLPARRWALSVKDPNAVSARDTIRFGRFLVTMLVQQRWAEAEPLALRVFAIQDSVKDSLARLTAGQIAAVYEGMGQRERAEQWRGR